MAQHCFLDEEGKPVGLEANGEPVEILGVKVSYWTDGFRDGYTFTYTIRTKP